MQREWLLRYMPLLFTFTNMKQKSGILINCLCHLHLHLHILPHQNIFHHFHFYHQGFIYFVNPTQIYKTPNILFVILHRSMPLSCILKVKKNMFLNYVFSKNVSVVNVKRLVMMIKIKIANGDKENKPLADFGLQLCFKV